jgi:hypothetical protein
LAGGIGVVLYPLDLTVTEAVGLIQTRSDFSLHGNGDIRA